MGPDWLAALLQCNTEGEKKLGHGSIFQLQAVMQVKAAELCTAKKTLCGPFHLQMSAHRVMTRLDAHMLLTLENN